MAKKKQETVSDIIDRIEEDLMTLRDKVEELENSVKAANAQRVQSDRLGSVKFSNRAGTYTSEVKLRYVTANVGHIGKISATLGFLRPQSVLKSETPVRDAIVREFEAVKYFTI